jgi:1,4-dihydroxy-2-naphthoyl-CoA hydrolase
MTDLDHAVPDGAVPLDGRPYGTGFSRALDLVLSEVTGDGVRAWAQVGAPHHQEQGIVHGGWYAAVVETVASLGAYTAAADDGRTVVGVSNTTEFFRPVHHGRLEVAAHPVHQGRTQQVWEVRITRALDGKLVSRGQVRLQHVDRST